MVPPGTPRAGAFDRTSKHNGVLRAAQNAIRARSVGSIILGDKEKPEVPDAAPQRHVRD